MTRIARFAGLFVAIGVAIYAIVAQWSDLHDALSTIGFAAPVLSLAFAVIGLVFAGLAWRAVVSDLGAPLPLPVAGRVFFLGQLGKYLPGGIWPIVAQMELGRDAGVARRRIGAAGAVVMVINVVSGLLVAIACLPFTSSHALHRAGWLLVFIPVGVVLLHPRVLNALLGRALRLLRREPLEQPATMRGIGVAFVFSLVTWAAYGAHLYVLAHPLADSGHRLPLLATGGFALAWVVGFLVVIAPSGAAAREAMVVVALAPVRATAPATAVALVSRVVMTVADLGCAAGAGLRAPARSPSDSS